MAPTTSLFQVQLIDATGAVLQSFDLHAASAVDAAQNAAVNLSMPHLTQVAAALVTGPGIESHPAYDAALNAVKLTRS